MTIDEACERLNMAEDLLGCALAHLEGDPGYANKQVIIDYLTAYFDFKKSGRPALVSNGHQPPQEK